MFTQLFDILQAGVPDAVDVVDLPEILSSNPVSNKTTTEQSSRQQQQANTTTTVAIADPVLVSRSEKVTFLYQSSTSVQFTV